MNNETFVVEFAGESVTIRTNFGLWEDVGVILGVDPIMLINGMIEEGAKAKMTPLVKAVLSVCTNKSIDQINELFRSEPGGKILTMTYVIWGGIVNALTPEVGGEADKDTQEDKAA